MKIVMLDGGSKFHSMYKPEELNESDLLTDDEDIAPYPRTSTPFKKSVLKETANSFVSTLNQYPEKFEVHGVKNFPRGILCGHIVMNPTFEKKEQSNGLRRKLFNEEGVNRNKRQVLPEDNVDLKNKKMKRDITLVSKRNRRMRI